MALSEGEPADQLVLGRKESRKTITVVAVRDMVTATTGEKVSIDVARLRTTWLFAAMNAPIPLGDLLRMAGLRSARTLVDLLNYCPPVDDSVVRTLLLQVTNAVPARTSGALA
jgi:hypothetical protein